MRKQLLWVIVFLTQNAAFASVVAPNLGTAGSFGLLGGTISNTGTSLVTGNVGAITTVTGFPPGTATGTVYPAPSNGTVSAAYSDFENAYNVAFSDATTAPTMTIADLTTSRTLLGNNVFNFSTTDVVSTTGINLTFDAQNNANEVFIIKVARDLTVNGPLTFNLINQAQADNIFWIIGRTAVISSSAGPVTFDGSILAGTSFTMSANPGGSGVLAGTINGCVFAETANTLAGKTNVGGCAATTTSTAAPEPSYAALLGLIGIAGFSIRARRRKAIRQIV